MTDSHPAAQPANLWRRAELFEANTYQRTPRLFALLDGSVQPTAEDMKELWDVFRTVSDTVGPEAVTLTEYARWIQDERCEVAW